MKNFGKNVRGYCYYNMTYQFGVSPPVSRLGRKM